MSSTNSKAPPGDRSPFKRLPTPSDFAQLHSILRSNLLPPDIAPEISKSIQTAIDEAPCELARYNAEIEALEKNLAALKLDQHTLESYTSGCRSVYSPVRRLPTEVLVEIFDLSEHTPGEEMERITKLHLIRLSQVCFCWRNIAMDTPRLWSTITIDATIWPGCVQSPATMLDRIELVLKRGGKFPLNLYIITDPTQPTQQPLLELLSQHLRRWQSLWIDLPPESLRFLAGAKAQLPLLESLTLIGQGSEPTPSIDTTFEVAERLKTATIANWPSAHPLLPWKQLRTFQYENTHSSNLSVEILAHLSDVVTVFLIIDPTTITPFELHPVVSNANTLNIAFTADPDTARTQSILGTLLDCLTLPDLAHLKFVRPSSSPPLWNHIKFRDFASRSSLCETLRSLEIWVRIEESELLESLSLLHSLQGLILWDCPECTVVTDSLLDRLGWREGESSLLPNLRCLTLTSYLRCRDDSLLDCVTSRVGHCSRDGFMFSVEVFWAERELSPDFLAQVSKVDGLIFSSSPDVVFW
ncbi:hypothetical protein C8R46DRAFT_1056566 [Mycena filopes]|nr:hypothetical protein C8R46DRAFT_1056566 [Mycena filopes]